MNLKISALEYVQEVQNGNISAEDFVSKTLEQIQTVDDKLHAFLSVNEKAIEQLRNDEYIPFEDKLIEKMNHYKGTYVHAPKMS